MLTTSNLGQNAPANATAAHDAVQHIVDMGAAISHAKSFNFGTTAATRNWLETVHWPTIQTSINVLPSFRYLGAHITTNEKCTSKSCDFAY